MEIRPVVTRRELKEFIYLPARIHRGHKNWVPPIYQDDWKYFDFTKNRHAQGCETIKFLVFQDGRPVGRIVGIISHRINELHREKIARFANLDCYNDQAIASALLNQVENWAQEYGMHGIIGPKGFSNLDPEGFLVEGFENEPTLSTYYNYEYIPEFLDCLGYEKHVDYVAYKIPVKIPVFYEKIFQRITRRKDFKLLEFATRKELRPFIFPVMELMNETYQSLDGYIPLSRAEMQSMAKRFLPLLDPRFVKAVEFNRQLVAFVLGIPNLNQGIRKARGLLFPFGLFHILRAAKSAPQLDLLLGAIREEFRGRGLDVFMGTAMYKSVQQYGFKHIDSHLELETNTKVRAEMERAGGKVYKRYRVYKKDLRKN